VDSFTLKKVEFDAVRRILSRFCSTSLGQSLARRISASRNPALIRRWLEETTQMVQAIREVSLPPFGGVSDISGPLSRAHPGGGATGEDFAAIAACLQGAASVKSYLNALPESLDSLRALAEGIGQFDEEVKAIRSIVAPDGQILDEASRRLAEIRRQIAATAQHVRDVIYGYLHQSDVAKLLQNATVTLHGDRYVLPVKAENRGRLPGVVHRVSNTGATVFVEPNACVELNNRLSDLYEDERREIRRLLNQLALRIQGRCQEIVSSLRCLAQVDLLSAKAQYAYQFDMTCPKVSEHGPLELRQARHPLLLEQAYKQEQAGLAPSERHEVVPIDVRLGQEFDLLVVTGSNTGGKTVALKTAALLALMAQSGLHIPAQRGATLPVFRDVFIDVGDEQSLQQSLSTFGAHMKRIRYILGRADRSSLVLLDELGAGTDPDEGGAIGQAVLDQLREIGCMGMISTHLSVLKAYAITHDRVENASVEFDTRTLCPTYRLRIGTPGESHAIAVAAHLGLGRQIISRAKEYLRDQGEQFRKAIRATGAVKRSAEAARAEAVAAQLAAEIQQESYQAKLADLHRLKEEFETWLATLPELKPGDTVTVPSLGKPGTLVRLELHKQIAVVDCDRLQVEVPLKELMPKLGQEKIRREINDLRRRILQEARHTEQARREAERLRQSYQQSLQQQQERARQFDTWLSYVARLKPGETVPIARKPGKGRLVKVDLPRLKVTVATDDGDLELPLQDVYPQTGPFAPKQARPHRTGPRQRPGRKDQPIPRRKTDSKAAKAARQALLQTQPGEPVYVVPFNKKATLIRLNKDKEQAVVQSGIFEMELPLSDLEPMRKKG